MIKIKQTEKIDESLLEDITRILREGDDLEASNYEKAHLINNYLKQIRLNVKYHNKVLTR